MLYDHVNFYCDIITLVTRPYSPCDMSLPISVTSPEMRGKQGVQPTSVKWTMRMSLSCIEDASFNDVTTRAVPCTTPRLTGRPKSGNIKMEC